jgi:hypothetical protein
MHICISLDGDLIKLIEIHFFFNTKDMCGLILQENLTLHISKHGYLLRLLPTTNGDERREELDLEVSPHVLQHHDFAFCSKRQCNLRFCGSDPLMITSLPNQDLN